MVFINDLFCELNVSLPNCFADDLKLLLSFPCNLTDDRLQNELNIDESWADKWLLKLNPQKCFVLHFGRNNALHDYSIYGVSLLGKNEAKDLGVIVDTELRFTSQVDHILKNGNRALGMILRTFSIRDPKHLVNLYKAYVLPILEYCSPLWNPHLLNEIDAIESVQRRFTRSFPALRNLSYPERLKTLGLDTLEYRRMKSSLALIYQSVNNNSTVFSTDLCKLHVRNQGPDSHSTRGHSKKLVVLRATSSNVKNFVFLRYAGLWNSLPEEVVSSPTLSSFKAALSKLDLSSHLVGRALRSE